MMHLNFYEQSAILNGKRELNTRQVKALATRFSVSPAVFL
jgi:antitoxin component HigA of HigAB toxin-antitoxin module